MQRQSVIQRGFTLIEMVIAILIVAMITGAALPMVNRLTNVNQKAAAQKIVGNIKYLYDRAVLERVYIRLVFDLDQNIYWSESTKDPFFLTQTPLTVEEGAVVIEEEEEEEEEEQELGDLLSLDMDTAKWQGWADFAEKFRQKKAEFSTYKTELSSRTTLPAGVRIWKVQTSGVEEAVDNGQIFVHFFPNGFMERTAIWVAMEDELEDETLYADEREIYTILTEPLTGRSTIYDTLEEMPEELEDEEAF